MPVIKSISVAFVACLVVGLSACTQSEMRISPDFGVALREDLAAQIADPDAHYAGTLAPGSSGARVGLAQQRYEKNAVIQPSSTTASSRASAGVDNGASGAGSSMGPSSQ